MKTILFVSALLAAFVAQASDGAKLAYLNGYAEKTYENYANALSEAQKVDAALQAFIQNPTQVNLDAAKAQWIESRKVYSVTEVYRFFDGPIDGGDDAPEGQINAWPMDEAYVDYVRNPETLEVIEGGIIYNETDFPVIDEATVIAANGDGAEENVATGWHAIEFILWGQDLPSYDKSNVTLLLNTQANRPLSDFTDKSKASQRRLQYLGVVSKLLVSDIAKVTAAWEPNQNNYRAQFVTDIAMFGKVIEAARYLASNELAIERMNVAYDSGSQEDEHSCFSDTTNYDIYYNFVGVKNVLTEVYNGETFIAILSAKNPALAMDIQAQLADIEVDLLAIPVPFDVALTSDEGRPAIKKAVTALQKLGDQLGQALIELQ